MTLSDHTGLLTMLRICYNVWEDLLHIYAQAFSLNISFSGLIYIFSDRFYFTYLKLRTLRWIHVIKLMQILNLSESKRSEFLKYDAYMHTPAPITI